MHRYSEERSQEAFDQSVHECGVCLSENTGRNFIQLPCNHSFCVKCMESYCGIHVKEGSVTRLACPDTSCRAPLPPPVLRRLLAEEGYARWESLALRRTLDTMPDVAYCPRCNAACVAAGDDAQCPAYFCGATSGTPASPRYATHAERQKLMRVSVREQMSEAQRLREQRKVEELLSLREVLRSTRQCPSCRMAIAKTEGCNKMVRDNCGQFCCYRCSRAISGYKHFVNGECGLFERVGRGRLPGQQAPDLDEDVEIKEPGWMRALRYKCPACGAKRTK
uniref:RING-type domain-containing protein n=1 Tax=Setaria italica TaxID=4555 RepID=K3YZW8_SETIT